MTEKNLLCCLHQQWDKTAKKSNREQVDLKDSEAPTFTGTLQCHAPLWGLPVLSAHPPCTPLPYIFLKSCCKMYRAVAKGHVGLESGVGRCYSSAPPLQGTCSPELGSPEIQASVRGARARPDQGPTRWCNPTCLEHCGGLHHAPARL